MMLKCAGWVLVASLCASPGMVRPATPNLRVDNPALIRHIKATDFVFRAVFGTCTNESLQRSSVNGKALFRYQAKCAIKPAPDNGDCGAYQVTARGTVDTPTWATVRDIRLKLLCSA